MGSRARVVLTLLLAAAMLGGCGLFGDVEDSVDGLYDRNTVLDNGTARGYAATGAPTAVAAAIAGASQPINRLTAGDRQYLQYDDEIVRVQPGPGGSTVLVDDYANGYRRWAGDLSSVWGAQAPIDDDGK